MSVIYYKFKAAKDSDYDVFTFDGAGATVFDVKREIIRAKKLGKGTDFDLAIYNAQTDEEYKDDVFVIPRNTSVIVRRLPPSRPGKGTAQRYVLGALPTDGKGMGSSSVGMLKSGPLVSQPTERFSGGGRNMVFNAQQFKQSPKSVTPVAAADETPSAAGTEGSTPNAPLDDSEEARIQAMFQQTTDQWGAMQEKLAEQTYIPYIPRGNDYRRGRGGYHGGGTPREGSTDNKDGANQMPIRVPPPTYVCYRCGQKGHYINQCPTNGDKDYDKHPRIKRTTGIPRSFLKVIEEPKNAVKSGTGGLMVTPKGDIVVAQADSSTWDKHVAKAATTINLGTATAGDILDYYESIPVPSYLACPLCEGVLREATITPCCGTTFCDECIRGYMLENDFACQDCKAPIPNGLDGLIANMDIRDCVENYIRDYARNH
ncbi:DWNN domain-containing protein [Radiomyces spectabilis]|uniref:DWNN domain-containing protein n=1 Tax=Radiomyces spectabilis TaxID=64574 RepID=UPI00221EBC67|nr:DWNN domain-containing protein [Radiomyces spectabilis]KAI8374426.1 DWNN domain-containing protein [Radiomyces spectabilis]